MLLLILYLPLIGSIVSGGFGFIIGRAGSFIVTITSLAISFCFSVVFLFNVIFYHDVRYLALGFWINSGTLSIEWSFAFDALSTIMVVLVLLISTLVHVYSCEYMFYDPHSQRFMAYLSIFTFFMLILVCSDNFIVFFLGWEGIGLSSFLLISFWTTRIQAVKAALKAMIINRFGDFFFLIAVCCIFFLFGSLDFLTVFYLLPFYKDIMIPICGLQVHGLTFIAFFLFLASVGKSAQFALHTWLPDAMEGPTPVSALIHAATMVTAGVFLIFRCSAIFQFADTVLDFLVLWGSLTVVFSSLASNFQTDIKKIIAYSTSSQLGYMFVACGLSDFVTAFFHLVNHAFFKALLFLCAGVIIHNSFNEQDLRKLTVSFERNPLTITCLDVGVLCLVSFPFFGGFYSKDLILELASQINGFAVFSFYCLLFGVLLTSIYGSSLVEVGSEEEYISSKAVYFTRKDPGFILLFPLVTLVFLSVFSGPLLHVYFDATSGVFFDSIYIRSTLLCKLYSREYVPQYLQLLPIVLMFIFLLSSSLSCFSPRVQRYFFFFGTKNSINKNNFFYLFENLLINNFFIENFYYLIINFFFWLSTTTSEYIDKGLLEIFGSYGVSQTLEFLMLPLRSLTLSGKMYHYFCSVFIFLLIYFFLLLI